MEIKGFGSSPIGKIKTRPLKDLMRGLFAKGELVFLSGSPKVGKTLFTLRLAVALSTAKPFLGKFLPCNQKKICVLLVSLEDNFGEIRARIKSFLGNNPFPRNLLLSHARELSLPNDFKRLEADIREVRPEVIIIDPLRRCHSCDEDSSSSMAPIINGLRRIVQEYNCTVLVVHHTGHSIHNPENAGSWLRGTSDFYAAWETLIGLEKRKDSVKVRVFHKYSSGLVFDYKVIMDSEPDKDTGIYNIKDLVFMAPDFTSDREDDDKVFLALGDGPCSANTLTKVLKKKLSRVRIDAALDRLSRAGRVNQEGGVSKNSKWRRLDSS